MNKRAIPLLLLLLPLQAMIADGAEKVGTGTAVEIQVEPPESTSNAELASAVNEHENSSLREGPPAPQTNSVVSSGTQSAQLKEMLSDLRSLYSLQDAAAAGHRDAVMLQEAMLRQIDQKLAERMPEGDPGVLVQSVVGFVLSGGNPSAADRLSGREGLSASHRELLRGVSLYMQGKRKEASEVLVGVEAKLLQPSIAGRVALVQAMLEDGSEERRQALLALAIASMPGSLVEESALRRSALFYARNGHQQLFWKRANRYLRRFPNSIYGKPFLNEVMNSILKLESDRVLLDRFQVDNLLEQIPQAGRRAFYLELARRAAARNLVDLVNFASRRSLRLSLPGSQEAQIAGLYSLIFGVASEGPVDVQDGLRDLNGELLPPLEQRMLKASLAVVEGIRQPAAASTLGTLSQVDGELALDVLETAELSLAKADKSVRESFW